MSAAGLICDLAMEATQPAVRKFKTLEAAHEFWKGKSRLEFTICATTDDAWPWEVRPKNDLEIEQDKYWIERLR